MKCINLIRNEYEEDHVFRLVSNGAISAVVFLLIYIIFADYYKIKPTSGRFDVLFNLALSYLASYIFYILNIFIPKTNEKYCDYTLAAEVFSRIDYNFSNLKETYGLNAASPHQELVPILEAVHEPKAIALFTDKTSTLSGYTNHPSLTHQQQELANSYINFLYTTPVPDHYLNLNPFGLPINAVAIHLHGVAIMLDHLLKSTSHLPLIERLNINAIRTMISDELSKGNELDVLNEAIRINHIKLAIQYTNIHQRLLGIYQSESFPVSILKLRALQRERNNWIGNQTLENNLYALLVDATKQKNPA